MTDNERRGLVLKVYYDRRKQGYFLPSIADIGLPQHITEEDILFICDQLGQHGLLDWHAVAGLPGGIGRITARGVDVVEGVSQSEISISLDSSQNISIHGSSNVSISGSNTQANTVTVADLIAQITGADATPQEKAEVTGLLRRFLEHPLVVSLAGTAFLSLLDN